MTDSPSPNERRHFQRVQFEADALLTQDQQEQAVEVADLSLNGALLNHLNPESFDHDKPLHLTLRLTDNAIITMELIFAHQHSSDALGAQNAGRCGFRCTGIDLDSIAHLRRLVELNLGDSEALQRDLSELVGSESH